MKTGTGIRLILTLILLCSFSTADIDANITEDEYGGFLSIIGVSQIDYFPAGSDIAWKFQFGQADYSYMETQTLSYMDYSAAVMFIPKSEYAAYQSKVYSLGSLRTGVIAGGMRGNTLETFIRSTLGTSQYPIYTKIGWQKASAVETPFSVAVPNDFSIAKEYVAVGIGCVYREWDYGLQKRLWCDVADWDIGVYRCADCGSSKVCALDDQYMVNDGMRQSYVSNFGTGAVCLVKGVEGGVCSQTADCGNLVTKPSTSVTAGSGLYVYQAVRCEKSSPTAASVAWLGDHLNHQVGTCEKGAKTANIDCPPIFGYPSDYHTVTTRGTYYNGFSGWGVKDGSCILGECGTFADCYSLYASIYYECMPSTMSNQQEMVGVCKQTQWTAGLIQQKCEEAEGRKPSAGKAWTVNADGQCVEITPLVSQCSTSAQCSCPSGQVASCQIIQTGSGQIGQCICVDSSPPVFNPVCGDGTCSQPAESVSNCAVDCHCGNGVCESQYSESFVTCMSDCSGGGGGGGDDGGDLLLWVVAILLVGGIIVLGGVGAYLLLKRRRGVSQ